MRNQYKRSDIFTCSNQAHVKFNKKVSVYHVLKVKQCYPNGCVYFFWKCKKLNKGESCPKKYQHVGKKCFGCKEYYDEKITNLLRVNRDEYEWQQFQEDLQNFEDWLESVRNKTLPIHGEITGIKPHLVKYLTTDRQHLQLKGFILTFKECFIDRDHFEDFAYAVINPGMQKRYAFSVGDSFDFLARVTEDHGRILFRQVRRVEFDYHQDSEPLSNTDSRISLLKASECSEQLEKCFYCEHGALVDIKQDRNEHVLSRRMYCLEGVKNPRDCVIPVFERMTEDSCPQ